jgi:hypothetical protein
MLAISKTIAATQTWRPFEEGEIAVDPGIGRVEVADGAGRVYVDGVAVPATAERIESSAYAVIDFASPPPAPVIIRYIRYHGVRAGTRSSKTSNA